MTTKVDTLLESAVQAGLSQDVVNAARAALPPDKHDSPEALMDELVRRGKLSRFQANHILKGKLKALLLGSYILQEPIGQGGMGVVYSARHLLMDRRAAIKILPPELSKNPQDVKRFLREMKAAAKLEHPNIVQAYDAACANGRYFLAMEYANGYTLDQVVKRRGALPVSMAVSYVIQAARGLAYAHQRGIIHRDIKPSNLILGQGNRLQILDMGLARIMDDGTGKSVNLTAVNTSMGTADFMAPEQAIDLRVADARSDIYSLGCTLYFLIRGQVMFADAKPTARLMAHQQSPAPVLNAGRNDVPLELDRIFQRMVAKKPEERYQKITDVIADLQRMSGSGEGGDTAVTAPSKTSRLPRATVERKKKDSKSKRLQWIALAAVAILPLIVFVGYEAWTIFRTPATNEWQGAGNDKLRYFTGHHAMVESAAFSRDGRLGLSGSGDKTINMWDVDNARIVRTFTGHTQSVYAAMFTTDMRRVISASADKTVRVWDADSGNELQRIDNDTGVFGIAVSKDGKQIVGACGDGSVRVWDAETKQELQRLGGHQGKLWSVAMSPDGKRAVSGGDDKIIRLWDLEKGEEIRTFSGHTAAVRRLAFSPDGSRVLSGSWDRTMRLWNVATGEEVRRFSSGAFYVEGVAFSPDGRRAISGEGLHTSQGPASNVEHGVCLWDLETGKLIERCSGNNSKVLEVAYSPNGRHALFACQDNCLRCWELPK